MLSFEQAKAVVQGEKLNKTKGWRKWVRDGKKPPDIPAHPDRKYRRQGWVSWPDFLGYDARKSAAQMRPFEEARAHARQLNLHNYCDWKEYSRTGSRPPDVPSHPDEIYSGKGWISWPDFLGYDLPPELQKLPYEDARNYIRPLKLKGYNGFRQWKREGKRPPCIPSHPDAKYRNSGWVSWSDFLGCSPRIETTIQTTAKKRPFALLLDAIQLSTQSDNCPPPLIAHSPPAKRYQMLPPTPPPSYPPPTNPK
jgi:hypothetical protein